MLQTERILPSLRGLFVERPTKNGISFNLFMLNLNNGIALAKNHAHQDGGVRKMTMPTEKNKPQSGTEVKEQSQKWEHTDDIDTIAARELNAPPKMVHRSTETETGCIELSKAQYNERSKFNAEDTYTRVQRQISQASNNDESLTGSQLGSINGNRNTGRTSDIPAITIGEELQNDIGRSVSSSGTDSLNDNEIDTEYLEEFGDGDTTQYADRVTDPETLGFS